MDKKSLRADLNIVWKSIKYLHEHPESNFEVTGPSRNYLLPYYWGSSPEERLGFPRPLDDSNALYAYYTKLKGILEKALQEGAISREELPRGAPPHLEELAIL